MTKIINESIIKKAHPTAEISEANGDAGWCGKGFVGIMIPKESEMLGGKMKKAFNSYSFYADDMEMFKGKEEEILQSMKCGFSFSRTVYWSGEDA